MTNPEPSIIFLHIPKAGGTTLHKIIEQQYDPSLIFTLKSDGDFIENINYFKMLPSEQRLKYKVLKGHMLFRHRLDKCMSQPCAYITLLRDPIDRIISYYHYILRTSSHYLHEQVVSQKMNLKEFVASGISPEINNFQTDMLATVDSKLLEKYGKFHYPKEQLFESAKNNILKYFSIAGILEQFDEFLILAQKILGWKKLYYAKQNVTENRPTRDVIPDGTLSVLEENNQLDIQLYKFVQARMNESTAQHGPSFKQEVQKFKLLNESKCHSKISNVIN
jgi:hypothetical protein